MEQTFDQYPGPPQNYTLAMITADFPKGVTRLSSLGTNKTGGLAFAKGYGRGYVGDGALRNAHPQGAYSRQQICICWMSWTGLGCALYQQPPQLIFLFLLPRGLVACRT